MFKIEPNPTYWWPVTVRRPSATKPGQIDEHVFQAKFRWLDDEAHAAMLLRAVSEKLTDRQVVPEFWEAFSDVQAADGSQLACTPDTMAALLAEQGVAAALSKAYIDSRNEAAQKNS